MGAKRGTYGREALHLWARSVRGLDGFLTKPRDRELFDLPDQEGDEMKPAMRRSPIACLPWHTGTSASPIQPSWGACARLPAMSTMAFDTLATVRALEEAGMDATQAEAVTGAIGGAIGSADTVTRAGLDAALLDLELRLTRRMYALAIAQAGATVALTVTLLRLLA